jgi:hypothetical protein
MDFQKVQLIKIFALIKRMFALIKSMKYEKHMIVLVGFFY